MFTFTVNIDGLERKFLTLADSAQDLEPVMRKWVSYKMKLVKEVYAAQDFAPLARSTIAHRAALGLHSTERKLKRDVRKAISRAVARTQRPPRGLIERLLSSKRIERAVEQTIGLQSRGAQARVSVLAAFQQQHKRERTSLADRINLKPLSVKQMASLNSRMDRAVAKAVGRPVLGDLGKTLHKEASNGEASIESATKYRWSKIHNEGGTGGHGAQIPERKTLEITEADLNVLEVMLKEHLLLAF